MIVSLIAAVSENYVIGNKGKIPWNLPADLKRFKKITMGHHIIMGRETFESIGKPLPGRKNIVVSRNKKYEAEGCRVVHSLKDALEIAKTNKEDEVFVIGGEQIYSLALPRADKIYLTKVKKNYEGDTFFPEMDMNNWKVTSKESFKSNGDNPLAFEFIIYEKNET
ncbi:MAG: dihydrofolate reductase [Candidatus Woesebacteria bacterium]|jgi:dihydrofolate reductase